MNKKTKAGFFPAGLLLVLKRTKQTLVENQDPVEAESILDMALARVRRWPDAFIYKHDLRRTLEKARDEVNCGSPLGAEIYIDNAIELLQPKSKDANTDKKNAAAAGAGRGQGRKGQGSQQGAVVKTGATGGVGAVAEEIDIQAAMSANGNAIEAEIGREMLTLIDGHETNTDEENLEFALVNLMHHARNFRLNFAKAVREARKLFNAEIDEAKAKH